MTSRTEWRLPVDPLETGRVCVDPLGSVARADPVESSFTEWGRAVGAAGTRGVREPLPHCARSRLLPGLPSPWMPWHLVLVRTSPAPGTGERGETRPVWTSVRSHRPDRVRSGGARVGSTSGFLIYGQVPYYWRSVFRELMVRVGFPSPAPGRCSIPPGEYGVWRSLVAHPLWERVVAGSNPVTPTSVRSLPRAADLPLRSATGTAVFRRSPRSAGRHGEARCPHPAPVVPRGARRPDRSIRTRPG